MNPTVLRADVPDVIAHAFYTIGYRPRESLVVIGMSGPRHQVGMTIRLDLPATARQRLPLEGAVRMLRDHGDDTVVGLIVCDGPVPPDRRPAAPSRPPRSRLAHDVRRRLRAAGFVVLDMLSVTTSGWCSYLCRDPLCCPPGGRPLDEITGSALAAWHVANGRVLADDERSLLAYVDPPPEPGARGGAGAGDADGPAACADVRPAAGAGPSGAVLESLVRWRRLLRGAGASAGPAPDLRWLCAALADLRFRDAVLVTLLPGSASLPDTEVLGLDPARFEALHSASPDEDLLERGTTMLAAVARTAPPGRRAEALALLAWASWWAGDGARGRLLAERALADDPGHTLASLVEQLLIRGVAPGWVRSRAG